MRVGKSRNRLCGHLQPSGIDIGTGIGHLEASKFSPVCFYATSTSGNVIEANRQPKDGLEETCFAFPHFTAKYFFYFCISQVFPNAGQWSFLNSRVFPQNFAFRNRGTGGMKTFLNRFVRGGLSSEEIHISLHGSTLFFCGLVGFTDLLNFQKGETTVVIIWLATRRPVTAAVKSGRWDVGPILQQALPDWRGKKASDKRTPNSLITIRRSRDSSDLAIFRQNSKRVCQAAQALILWPYEFPLLEQMVLIFNVKGRGQFEVDPCRQFMQQTAMNRRVRRSTLLKMQSRDLANPYHCFWRWE